MDNPCYIVKLGDKYYGGTVSATNKPRTSIPIAAYEYLCLLPHSASSAGYHFTWATSPLAKRMPKVCADKFVSDLRQWDHPATTVPIESGFTAAEMFETYRDMACRIAVRNARRFRDITDLEPRALSFLSLIITEKWDTYDPTRSGGTNRNTWVYRSIVWHLQKTATIIRRRGECSLDLMTPPIEEPVVLDTLEDAVSEDAATIVNMIRQDPHGIAVKFRLPKHHRPFQEHLVTLGWSWTRIRAAWAELTGMFSERVA